MRFLKKRFGKTADEAELIRRYRSSGDLHLLAEVFQPYMEQLYAVCYKYFRTEEDAQDAVMELFEKLSTELRVHEPRDFKAWLYVVARNHCLMKMRQRVSIENAEPLEAVEDTGDEETGNSISDAQLDHLRGCIGLLPDHQRQSVELFYLRDMCYRQIADLTGFDLKRVKSYLQNGKRNLKICLERHGKG